MSDDFLKLNPNEINWDINFPSYTTDDNKENKDKIYSLFHCCSCGFHPTVICETRPKGISEITQIRLLQITPNGQKIVDVLGDKLPNDIETYDTLLCGICGLTGAMGTVPGFVLHMSGILNKGDEVEEERSDD